MTSLKPASGSEQQNHHPHTLSTLDFQGASSAAAANAMRTELNRLISQVKDENERKLFQNEMGNFFLLFNRWLADRSKGTKINWDKVNSPPEDQIVPYDSIPKVESSPHLNKLAVLKLNGGLGTTMGCVGPKSAIEVRDGMTFLDLSVRQIEYLNKAKNVNVPFILMNSFNTDDETKRIVQKYATHNIEILTFNQSRYPREYVFVSNVDNLGATVDEGILNHMVESDAEFLMEVTDKTRADIKGGTLIDYEGSIRLLEIAQVPSEHVEDFKSIKKFKIFNTNNLWVNLKAIKRVVEDRELSLEVIVNNKTTDSGEKVIQLETAVGAGIKHFHNAHGVNVPRSRFLPVKSTSDLFLVTSDLYSLNHGELSINPKRMFNTVPLVKLGDHFKKVNNFLSRFNNPPHILELDHLTVTGDVSFGSDVVLKGTVIIVANAGSHIDIPSGSILENKVVSGNLHILDH
ncbi:UTP-glucose-1-phosphate uridylyltransferase [Podila verticillata]|nr:UTP-glucose-1-phosphate uridylyltransferase [Podila verticillata]